MGGWNWAILTSLYMFMRVLLYMTVRQIVICNLKAMLRAVHWVFPDFGFMWLVEEAKKNMPLELDFLNEGHNAEKVADMLGHFPFLKVHTCLQYIHFYKASWYNNLWSPQWDLVWTLVNSW